MRTNNIRRPVQFFAPLVMVMPLLSTGCSSEPVAARSETTVAQAAPVADATSAPQQQSISANQAPGQYDVLEGTAVQLRAQDREAGSEPDANRGGNVKAYQWEIVEGQGGRLLNADTPTVTFYAPGVTRDVETFAVKLTTSFADGTSSSATLLIRVHKNAPKAGADRSYERRYGYSPWFWGSVGFGFGYIWNYPVYIPILIPWPGEELLPEDLDPIPPEALLPDEIDELPDELAPEVVLPPDVDFPDVAPDLDTEPLDVEPLEIEAVPLSEEPMDMEPDLDASVEPMPEPMDSGFGDDFGGDDFGGDLGGGDFGGGDF